MNSLNLAKNLIGIEREGLRVKPTGCIATTPHPVNFGSALTNKFITTDFSESLVEIVTPPLVGADKTLDFLQNTLHFVYQNLENNENFWTSSMPCLIRGQTEINIAKYGSSNVGIMKEVYRKGLANRYGKAMQVVAGIHFNYSFSEDFWLEYQIKLGDNRTLTGFKNDKYMGLIRNVLRFGWIIFYYFGASNSVCKQFLNNFQNHNLMEFDENTLYLKNATSLRMSNIGYQNNCADEAGIKANYNSLCQYTHSLQSAMQTKFDDYAKFNGDKQQLNDNILQIENEYYSSIRPKPLPESGIMPSISLQNNGIEYIELRSLDINPLNPMGINKEQILFLESFLFFCLTEESPPISSKEQVKIDENNAKVATDGLNKNLNLTIKDEEVPLVNLLGEIGVKIAESAAKFGKNHKNAVKKIIKDKTVAQKILEQMVEQKQGFHSFSNNLAIKHQDYFKQQKIDENHMQLLQNEAKLSLVKTAKIEASDKISFENFLHNYYEQL